MKYLKLYKQWSETGRITERKGAITLGGLCSSEIGLEKDLGLFRPEGFLGDLHWGYSGDRYYFTLNLEKQIRYEFTPLRQNIVLLLAAMNNEL